IWRPILVSLRGILPILTGSNNTRLEGLRARMAIHHVGGRLFSELTVLTAALVLERNADQDRTMEGNSVSVERESQHNCRLQRTDACCIVAARLKIRCSVAWLHNLPAEGDRSEEKTLFDTLSAGKPRHSQCELTHGCGIRVL
ncbi:hypothetical protein EDD18DRAFT_1176080, partial [Armillaria luteobubalina]